MPIDRSVKSTAWAAGWKMLPWKIWPGSKAWPVSQLTIHRCDSGSGPIRVWVAARKARGRVTTMA